MERGPMTIDQVKEKINAHYSDCDEIHLIEPFINDILNGV